MPTTEQRLASAKRKELGLARCVGCGDRPQSDFDPSPGRRPFGLRSRCRACHNNRESERYIEPDMRVRLYKALRAAERAWADLRGTVMEDDAWTLRERIREAYESFYTCDGAVSR
jgi:hypothetical protein